jgi:predicted esterase
MTASLGWTRRRFLAAAGAAALAPLGCLSHPAEPSGGGSARLTARPGTPSITLTPGTYPLGLGPSSYDGFLLVPESYVAGTPMPLVLALHGAGSRASGPLEFLRPYAEAHGFLVVSVDSVGLTWDAITFKYLTDVQFIDRALAHVFERCSVDPARIVVEGFSDGATYALGLGLANGDLFPRVVAFSPGGIVRSDTPHTGTPEFFISHGRQDPILPIDLASRAIVTDLRDDGYTVQYYEFDGGHEILPEVAELAAVWLTR